MSKKNSIVILSHLLVWLVLFSMPYLLTYGQEQEIDRLIAHFWIPMLFSAVIFYSNYFVIIDRFLFTKKTVLFVSINIILIAGSIFFKEIIETTYFRSILNSRPNNGKSGPPFKMFIFVQMIMYMAPLLFSIAIKTTRRWVKNEAEQKEAANFKLQSELQHLHYQLQPHFFFNSLNNIYSLVDLSPEQAKTSIHGLSKLMRYMLYDANVELVPISKEIDFMKKYIDLMKLRVSDKTKVTYSFPSEESSIKVAPLLFISLIENAFKHGVSSTEQSEISIQMIIQDGSVLFKIENDNFPKKTDDKSGSGIGLQNLEKRLQLLYTEKYSFTSKVETNRFLVHLEIETA